MACSCGGGKESLNKYLAPLREILEGYEKDEKYLIPILQDAQDEYGYLPEDVLKEIATFLDMSLSQVYGVVTFYTQFHLEPRGKNVLRVCMGTACHVRGGAEVLQAVQDELGIENGETTEDLKFTLETVACIGACGLAPVMMINDDTHGRLTPEKVKDILKEYI
ncbi:NADH-quinone oxidoreductase subunit NuoE [Iocasia frigidifontis]|uniref:NADH-quinone oxidoreductase subunit NuoE n=1 Tax=Iocasia fonsfrigidae TaxID=2682810 RepID=A0A8A7KCY0_9FIRM|nr:NADH-quinone oxidoreductase subunit NuoE [Iocasia fonsfrigidae]QTL99646.1 NADH-quinone oxidoreductase subunit NuoE [Iocasia fonsfrigidae]